MFVKLSSKVFLLVFFSIFVQSLADSDQDKCTNDRDCGEGAEFNNACDRTRGVCNCPGKKYALVTRVKPQCQKIASIGEECRFNEQCLRGPGGFLSRCHENKCECYDTANNREVVRPYDGVCYRATSLGEPCDNELQCRAFIKPESHVKCSQNATTGHNVCQCDQGIECEHKKSGTATLEVQIASLIAFLSFGLMATKVAIL